MTTIPRDTITKTPLAIALFFLLCAGLQFADDKQLDDEKWKLVWSDEFEDDEIDRNKWDFDLGNGFFNYDANVWIAGWGNGELEYYTKDPENARIDGGVLRIRALKESRDGFGYTSARMKTRKRDGSPLFATKYGKIEIRAKLPVGQGIWPALWMLPAEEKFGGWASSGEIDIVEARGQEPGKVLGTLHYGSRWPAHINTSREFKFPDGESIAEFHVYTLEWEPGVIRWGVDGEIYATQDFWWSSSKTNGVDSLVVGRYSGLTPPLASATIGQSYAVAAIDWGFSSKTPILCNFRESEPTVTFRRGQLRTHHNPRSQKRLQQLEKRNVDEPRKPYRKHRC